jgi:hypothetical protein
MHKANQVKSSCPPKYLSLVLEARAAVQEGQTSVCVAEMRSPY